MSYKSIASSGYTIHDLHGSFHAEDSYNTAANDLCYFDNTTAPSFHCFRDIADQIPDRFKGTLLRKSADKLFPCVVKFCESLRDSLRCAAEFAIHFRLHVFQSAKQNVNSQFAGS